MNRNTIVIVSGLPRSGTSMLMHMLEGGGMRVLTDEIRTADDDNPEGYFEFERVKQIETDRAWLEDAKGKAVKMISALLKYLPRNYSYRIIFMIRKMEEILASQKRMLVRRNKPTDDVSDEKLSKLYLQHLEEIKTWLKEQSNIDVIYMNYNEMLENSGENVKKINDFLDNSLSEEDIVNVVDQTLYHQRK